MIFNKEQTARMSALGREETSSPTPVVALGFPKMCKCLGDEMLKLNILFILVARASK